MILVITQLPPASAPGAAAQPEEHQHPPGLAVLPWSSSRSANAVVSRPRVGAPVAGRRSGGRIPDPARCPVRRLRARRSRLRSRHRALPRRSRLPPEQPWSPARRRTGRRPQCGDQRCHRNQPGDPVVGSHSSTGHRRSFAGSDIGLGGLRSSGSVGCRHSLSRRGVLGRLGCGLGRFVDSAVGRVRHRTWLGLLRPVRRRLRGLARLGLGRGGCRGRCGRFVDAR